MPQKKHSDQVKALPTQPQKTIDRHADFHTLAKEAEAQGDWKTAANLYALSLQQRSTELALINSVQEGLSSRLEMQAIYNLVGDKLRDTFDAQVVMISQYDPLTHTIFHHYAIERGQHINIHGWHPIDSSRLEIVRTGKPYMIGQAEIVRVIEAEMMHVIPGTGLPKTWLGVPMLVGSQVIGIVSLQNLDKDNAFSTSDIDLLTALTNSLSLSLENARLFNETQRLLNHMEQEMDIARQTQQGILPVYLPKAAGYDFGALMKPAQAVGGDFYDFIHLDNHRVCIVIGDVSDKGLPAALFMALTFSLLRAETGRAHQPRQILRNVNHYLLHMNASNMYVTLLYCVLDLKTGLFSYFRAGHLLPILIAPSGALIKIATNEGQPLGMFEDVKIDEQQCLIPPGGMALLYSDGLTEATSQQDEEFGLPRAMQAISAHRQEKAQIICDSLWLAVQHHCFEGLHPDDFTALIIKRD